MSPLNSGAPFSSGASGEHCGITTSVNIYDRISYLCYPLAMRIAGGIFAPYHVYAYVLSNLIHVVTSTLTLSALDTLTLPLSFFLQVFLLR